jgi:hypothetical protein
MNCHQLSAPSVFLYPLVKWSAKCCYHSNNQHDVKFFFFSISFCGTEDWTLSPKQATQALYYLSYIPAFCFWDEVLLLLPGWPQICNPPASIFRIAGIIGTYHHIWSVISFSIAVDSHKSELLCSFLDSLMEMFILKQFKW